MTGHAVIAILDYDTAQTVGLRGAFEEMGVQAAVASTVGDFQGADRVVLPNAANLASAAASLRDRGWVDPLIRVLESGRPILAIAAGLHLLMDRARDDAPLTGLGVVRGRTVPFTFGGHPAARHFGSRHTGLNRVEWDAECPVLAELSPGDYFYFDHEAFVEPAEPHIAVGRSNHGIEFCSTILQDSILGTEFLPERSGEPGRRLLAAFARI